MFAETIFWTCNALLVALLLRAAWAGFLPRYRFFYGYLLLVLTSSILRLCARMWYPESYFTVYWYSQFLSAAAGWVVMWEIYALIFRGYVGAERVARFFVTGALLYVLAARVMDVMRGMTPRWLQSLVVLERDLRTAHAVVLFLVVLVIIYYRIEIGRNLQGIVYGFSFFLGTGLVLLTLRSHIGVEFFLWWAYLQPVSYLAVLIFWSTMLWSYQPKPLVKTDAPGLGYAQYSAATSHAFGRARAYFSKVFSS